MPFVWGYLKQWIISFDRFQLLANARVTIWNAIGSFKSRRGRLHHLIKQKAG